MIIRPAREEDYDALAQVWIEGYWASAPAGTPAEPGQFEALRARLPREAATGGWKIFAAEDDGMIVGLLAITPEARILNELFLGNGARSLGTGKAMLDIAKQEMPGGFSLRTHITNSRAHRFYEREGMRHTHNAPHPNHPEAIFRHYAWP